MADLPDRRLLLVHAHPDDETITCGATMARYAAEGAGVTLVTCTLGEEGEIVLPELADLAADRTDRLGEHRIGELARACAALGVRDHRFLGGTGRWRDSGMMGTPANDHPRAFWRADPDEPARELVRVLREVRPQVVVTYDENGGYGHPDHIRAHDVAMAGVGAAATDRWPELGAPWAIAKVYYTAVPRSVLQAGLEVLRSSGPPAFRSVERAEDLPFAVPDEIVTTAIDARQYLPAKLDALRAHASQVSVDGPFFALSNAIGQNAFGIEYFRLAQGSRGPAGGVDGRESDLFAGLGAS
jgi:N-acetyl-1-D-myo-inositol-2-amino-2-deoxy-alpha-D-glucopyranoside deacetylase